MSFLTTQLRATASGVEPKFRNWCFRRAFNSYFVIHCFVHCTVY